MVGRPTERGPICNQGAQGLAAAKDAENGDAQPRVPWDFDGRQGRQRLRDVVFSLAREGHRRKGRR